MLNDQVQVWQVDMDESSLAATQLEGLLGAAECERARQFVFSRDRRRFVMRRAFVRVVLGRYTGNRPEAIEFAYTTFGKPYLVPNVRDIRFNVSHSEGQTVCAVTQGCEVGVDIERQRPIPDAMAIATRFFSPAERAALETLPEMERATAFLSYWTRKEACVKGLGPGLSHPLHSFDVTTSAGTGRTSVASSVECGGKVWGVREIELPHGFVGAIAVQGHALAARTHAVWMPLASLSTCARVLNFELHSTHDDCGTSGGITTQAPV